jgi:hypothetical protein
MNVTSRLQWRLGPGNGMLVLMPVLFHTRNEGTRHHVLTQALGDAPPLYDTADNRHDSRFTVGRLNLQYRSTLGSGLRLEANGGTSAARGESNSLRQEFDPAATLQRIVRDSSRTRDRTATLNGKLSKLLDGDHSLVTGAEIESLSRNETRSTEQDNQDPLADFEGDLQASSLRLALYAQDEWAISPNWSAHAGLRWESIRTRGDNGDGTRPDNRSSVLTPLAHAVWKPDPKSRDQVRLSLTRSYKAPTLQNLVARPVLSSRYPAAGANTPTSPDRAGNPDLRPELASGIDVAFERYLPQGGVLSANLFHRRSRQLPDAAALELPPPDAGPEHGASTRTSSPAAWHQGDADRAGGARHLDDRADILVFVVIYFVTMVAVVGGFDCLAAAALPGLAGAVRAALAYFVPRLGKVAAGAGRRALADDRAHHRRLHQHRHRQAVLASHREATFARAAMASSTTVHAQMRLVSGFEIVNHMR